MPRSHPPTLLTTAQRTLREECGVTRGSRILLALSGGGDSMALLHVLAVLGKKQGFFVCAHGVDHGLRPEAGAELDRAEARCAELGVAFSRTVIAVASGGNLQARAREARREALNAARAATGSELVATAHHADDRAETVLIRLLRGAGPRGLAVLPPRSGVWIRPLCRARKSDVLLHLERHGLAFAEDPSNENRRFLRTRVRHELLPLLTQLSPQITGHLCALADALHTPGEAETNDDTEAFRRGRESQMGGRTRERARAGADLDTVRDEHGVALSLNRAQRGLVGRALALGQRSARVSLAGGRELRLDPVTLLPILLAARPRKR